MKFKDVKQGEYFSYNKQVYQRCEELIPQSFLSKLAPRTWVVGRAGIGEYADALGITLESDVLPVGVEFYGVPAK